MHWKINRLFLLPVIGFALSVIIFCSDIKITTPVIKNATSVAYMSGKENVKGSWDIHVIKTDGSNHINLTHNDSVSYGYPSWSRDGLKIAFELMGGGHLNEIMVMNADGSNQIRLTHSDHVDEAPSWSPDGLQIAFVSYDDGSSEIFMMNIDGSNPTNVTHSEAAGENWPTWSPILE